jgi:hypothetical protein
MTELTLRFETLLACALPLYRAESGGEAKSVMRP